MMALLQELLSGKHDTRMCQPFAMLQYLIILVVRWNFLSTTYFLTQAQEAPVSWFELGCKCWHTSLALCEQVSVLPFLSRECR